MDLTISKLAWHGQVGVFAGLAVAAIAAFWAFYVVPTENSLTIRNGELEQLHAQINAGINVAGQLSEFETQVAKLEGDLETLKTVLPEEKDVADLLRRIQTLATQSNLSIKSFRPEGVETEALHIEWPFRLQIDGGYHDLGLFFDRISRFPRLINVSEIVITTREAQPGEGSVSVECVATAFVLRDPESEEDAAAEGAAAQG